MLIKQNTTQGIVFQETAGTATGYYTQKNGGGFFPGLGGIFNFPNPGIKLVAVGLQAVDTDTLGLLTIVSVDAGGNLLGIDNHQIVTALPGDPVFLDTVERNALALTLMTLANGVETGFTLRDVMKIVAGVLGGKASTVGNVWTVRNIGDTLDRVTVTVAPPADRTAVALDLS